MKKILRFDSLIIIDERNQKYSYFKFEDGLNVIHGKNTSGKSTLIQSFLYSIGINDVNNNLSDILNKKLIFRLDCTVNGSKYIFIRDENNFYVKHNEKIERFYGINSDISAEHIKLKEYINQLFNFKLNLELNGIFNTAPIEVMYLPYYISQDMGWISLRSSFKNLQYYKNFKLDYLDYYLGIDNPENREEKRKLEEDKIAYRKEFDFYESFEIKNNSFKISKFADEEFMEQAKKYLEDYTKGQNDLKKFQDKVLELSNTLSYYKTRKQILTKVKNNQLKQNPEDGKCPVCENRLNPNLENIYKYHQDINDTFSQIEEADEKIKDIQSQIDSNYKKIEITKLELNNKYKVVEEYKKEEVSFKNWITNKSNLEILRNIDLKKEQAENSLKEVVLKLKNYKTDNDLKNSRLNKDKEFENLFRKYLNILEVKNKYLFESSKFLTLYNSYQFPTQGVENHKVYLAYNFAFNKLIEKNSYVHRLPFLLDAIFNEDIEDDNRELITKFIQEHTPKDTQTFITVADSEKQKWTISDNIDNANFINIGENKKERALLEKNDFKVIEELYLEIQDIITKV
ncbi:P-loop NTPase family protein [Aliarcobacter butzleri]|uniref:hypothetical protein n=1 Tax=Aliarcobacter butzleri TaxID=28197 RepID=UPI002B2489FA|nr:hypothetical protein [Aliarcobacter butzleri]